MYADLRVFILQCLLSEIYMQTHYCVDALFFNLKKSINEVVLNHANKQMFIECENINLKI